MTSIRDLLGLWRSLIIYRAPWRIRRLSDFYADFVRPGDLCFDIGAHVGNHTEALLRRGARVVLLEPQPRMLRWLRRRYGENGSVTLLAEAAGAAPGSATLRVSRRTPTVSTLSDAWIAGVQQDNSFAGVSWEESVRVPVTTLDRLIADHGMPAFCKIDVEGYERQALEGLSHPLPALSFEYIPANVETAVTCIERLGELGEYAYNRSVAERYRLEEDAWLTPAGITTRLRHLPTGARSGDVYARRKI